MGDSSRVSPTVGPASVIAESAPPASRPSSKLAVNPAQQGAPPPTAPVEVVKKGPVGGLVGPPLEGAALLAAIQKVVTSVLAAGIKAP